MTRRRTSPRPHRSASVQRNGKSGGRLRIIGGDFRRRLLPVLDSPGLRPTPDRVRETLFNWLTSTTPGARVLDLFAGTGALGLEALSRGAREALFVERDARVAQALSDNVQTLGAEARGRVAIGDALAFLDAGPETVRGAGATVFSLVFLDPPFRQQLSEACCQRLEQGWLTPDAYIYLETESELDPKVPVTWRLHREVRAGDSIGRLYRRQAPADDE
ncbi:16S rRNA (guanine(966)-N(2))-methyltransferase RsmD [Billgrantia endophytica]|uniref:Ribosomal RNA small subunit methyltransferase D n=1 Tax=Billgrantia endophytica TaxID=2033802 RepID=A0A2N7U725_9GAMM|nr:16S rRNA (guanine(966)-N(2))-methyltransferase RsmD [Halomonas endophytica]PMR76225.1 16S rRNA (guanine(966)-N(2))-methyltransferase RsmD [Halomonas endophytica]